MRRSTFTHGPHLRHPLDPQPGSELGELAVDLPAREVYRVDVVVRRALVEEGRREGVEGRGPSQAADRQGGLVEISGLRMPRLDYLLEDQAE